MKIIECQQGTDEWKKARAGKVTASRIADIMANGKGSAEAVSRKDYRFQLVAEILTGDPSEDGFFSPEMKWGVEQEAFARAEYELQQDLMVEQVGLVLHPFMDRCAGSPDGIITDPTSGEYLGVLEIKCPKTSTHLAYRDADEIPSKYIPQMMWNMACTGLPWCDFVSFDPRLPKDYQLFVKRLPRDEAKIHNLQAAVAGFLGEVDAVLKGLTEKSAKVPA